MKSLKEKTHIRMINQIIKIYCSLNLIKNIGNVMNKLRWEFQQQLNTNKDGSFSTQQSRKEGLNQVDKTLKSMGYNQMGCRSFKGKHYQELTDRWKSEGKSPGTMKNLMSYLRWSARKNNLSHRVPSNAKLGIPNRVNITNENKGVELKQKHLDRISDPSIKLSIEMQTAFGLRREESIKYDPNFSNRGNKITLKASTTKGGLERDIPVETQKQRDLLDRVKQYVGNNGSLIPPEKSYKDQLQVYKNHVARSGLGKGHGLRHKWAQDRYKELTSKDCPVCGGIRQKDMTPEERAIDREARLQISSELGHSREQITSTYLGS